MDREQIIQWAREAGGIKYTEKDDNGTGMFATFDMVKFGMPMLEDFAKKVRDDYSNKHAQLWLKRIDEAVKTEREACAMVCETHAPTTTPTWVSYAAAIRARST
jgi:hypothetical protein